MNIRVAQIGARKGYAVPRVLAQAGQLERLYTDMYCDGWPSSLTIQVLNMTGKSHAAESLRGRKCPGIPRRLVRTFPISGLLNKRAVRNATRAGQKYGAFLTGSSRFAREVAQVRFENVDAVYAFSSAALEIFQAAKASGVTCILDHETAPAEIESALVHDIERQFEKWLPYTPRATEPFVADYASRQQEEVSLADAVICPSSFSAGLLNRSEGVEVVPFAMGDQFHADKKRSTIAKNDTPLRVLFVGNDEIRKGLPVLVAALERLPEGVAVVKGAGNWNLSEFGWNAVSKVMEPVGAIPRTQIAEMYQWADVFVMPTFSDTMGVVILEAMASGVPVVTTVNSGGPDLVRHETDGYVVDVGDSAAIAEILRSLHSDRKLLNDMSTEAIERAAEFDMERYGNKLKGAIEKYTMDRNNHSTHNRPILPY